MMYFPGILFWFALVLRMNALDWETEDQNIYLTTHRNVWMHFHIDIRSNGIHHKVMHKIIPKGNNCITPQRLSKRFFFSFAFTIHSFGELKCHYMQSRLIFMLLCNSYSTWITAQIICYYIFFLVIFFSEHLVSIEMLKIICMHVTYLKCKT